MFHVDPMARLHRAFLHTAISRKFVGKNVHATIPKGHMGYDQYSVPDFVAVEPTVVAFLHQLVNICPRPRVPFYPDFL